MDTTDQGDARIAQLRQLIGAHLNHVGQQIGPDIEIKPGSPGAAEQDNDETGPGGSWGGEPPHTALSLAKLKLLAAGDHMASLQKLLEPPLPLFGPMTMARASVEASASVYWHLEPGISVRERVARSFGDRIRSAEEEAAALQLLIDEWEDRGQLAALRAEAADLGIEPIRPPGLTSLVGAVMREHTTSLNRGRGVYKYMCAIAHGTAYAILQHLREIGESDDPRSRRVEGHVPIEAVEWSVSATLGAHSSAVDRWLKYCGLDRWAWERWQAKVGADLHASNSALRARLAPVGVTPHRPSAGAAFQSRR